MRRVVEERFVLVVSESVEVLVFLGDVAGELTEVWLMMHGRRSCSAVPALGWSIE